MDAARDNPETSTEQRLSEPICAVLTPLGRGAVATIGLRGPGALAVLDGLFTPASGRRVAECAPGQVVFGRFRALASQAEELVVGLADQESLEIHCHGGVAAASAVLEALVAAGCRRVSAEIWAHRTQADAIRAEALIALGQARTERTASILLDQYRGALREELARIEASAAGGRGEEALAAVHRLLARRGLGLHLTRPWRVALVGRPNAGKSSLMNALVGYQRAIVAPQPGTTRDLLTAEVAFDGWPVELVDTAGLRVGRDAVEAEGIARAQGELSGADLVLWIIDASDPAAARDDLMAPSARDAIAVYNKCDLAAPPAGGDPPGIPVSAKTGSGLEDVIREIARRLVPSPPAAGEPIPFTLRQFDNLASFGEYLAGGNVEAARRELAGTANFAVYPPEQRPIE